MTCQHTAFSLTSKVASLEDIGRFMLEVKVNCTECGKAFQFLGLNPGLNLSGASCDLDGLEGRFAICPAGSQPNPFQKMAHGGHNA